MSDLRNVNGGCGSSEKKNDGPKTPEVRGQVKDFWAPICDGKFLIYNENVSSWTKESCGNCQHFKRTSGRDGNCIW